MKKIPMQVSFLTDGCYIITQLYGVVTRFALRKQTVSFVVYFISVCDAFTLERLIFDRVVGKRVNPVSLQRLRESPRSDLALIIIIING